MTANPPKSGGNSLDMGTLIIIPCFNSEKKGEELALLEVSLFTHAQSSAKIVKLCTKYDTYYMYKVKFSAVSSHKVIQYNWQ